MRGVRILLTFVLSKMEQYFGAPEGEEDDILDQDNTVEEGDESDGEEIIDPMEMV